MAKRGTLTVRVISDTKSAERGLQQFGKQVENTGERMQAAGKKMTMFATVPIVGAMTLATNAAADLEQAVGGTEAVFGDLSGSIADVAKTAPNAMGLTEQEFREATTLIGGQLKRMTGDVELAADQSMVLVQTAADLAATYGGTTRQAVEALGAAFRGEADPAERFNLNLKIGEQNAKAVEMGLAATTAEVDEHARAQALLALIAEQSADAQGQFERELNTASGQLAVARAEIGQAAAEMGKHLLPMVTTVAGGVADLAAAFGDLPDPVQKGILGLAGIVAAAGPAMTVIGKLQSGATRAADVFATLRLRSMYLSDSLGRAGLAGAAGIAGLALVAVVKMFQTSAQKAEESRRRVDAWSNAIEEAGSVADGTTSHLSDLIRENGNLANSMAEADVSIEELQAALLKGGDAWQDMGRKLAEAGVKASDGTMDFSGLMDVLNGLEPELAAAAKQSESTSKVLDGLDKSADAAAGSTDELGSEMSEAQAKAKALEDASRKLTEAFNMLNGVQMSADEALIKVHDSFATLTEKLKENGATLDVNTEKGRDNRSQVMEAIKAAQDRAAAVLRETDSVDAATGALVEHVEQLKADMRQAGFTEEAIAELIERYNLTPDKITTSVELLNAEEAERKLNELARTRFTNIVVGAQIGAMARQYLDNDKSHAGGRVQAGVPRIIGRPGHEELFVPDRSGFIHSGIAVEAMRNRGSGQGSLMEFDYVRMGAAVAEALRVSPPVARIGDVVDEIRRHDRSLR